MDLLTSGGGFVLDTELRLHLCRGLLQTPAVEADRGHAELR